MFLVALLVQTALAEDLYGWQKSVVEPSADTLLTVHLAVRQRPGDANRLQNVFNEVGRAFVLKIVEIPS